MNKGIFIFLIIAIATSPALADSTHLMLEKGIFQEETIGNLQEASKIYQAIIDDSQTEKPFLAEALYRQANIYNLQGDQRRAQAALNRVISDYPKQTDFVKKAIMLNSQMTSDRASQLAAPWGEFENSEYVLLSPAGEHMGAASYIIQRTYEKGRPVWH